MCTMMGITVVLKMEESIEFGNEIAWATYKLRTKLFNVALNYRAERGIGMPHYIIMNGYRWTALIIMKHMQWAKYPGRTPSPMPLNLSHCLCIGQLWSTCGCGFHAQRLDLACSLRCVNLCQLNWLDRKAPQSAYICALACD